MLALLLLTSILTVSSSTTLTYGSTLGFQTHSFNDHRIWFSANSKASTLSPNLYMKLDPQYLPPLLCAGQTRVPTPKDPRGCLLFNHDTIGFLSRKDISSSEDLLGWLVDPINEPFTRKSNLTISLCFKGCGGVDCPCNGSSGSDDWLSLVDDFLSNLTSLISTNSLTTRLLLDGDGNPAAHTCLAQRWRPINSVYITGDDPAEGFTSNDPSLGYDRLIVLNEPADAWAGAASQKFGKFLNGSEPYIVWEPSDQPGLLSAIATYTASNTPPHAPGMLFASNTDVAQWASYTSPGGGPGYNQPLVTGGQSPRLVSFTNGFINQFLLLELHQNVALGTYEYSFWFTNTTAPGLISCGGGGLLPSLVTALGGAPLFMQGADAGGVWISGPLGSQHFSYTPCSVYCFSLLPDGSLLPNPLSHTLATALHYALVTDPTSNNRLVVAVLPEADAPNCTLLAWIFPPDPSADTPDPTCLVSATTTTPGVGVGGDIPRASITSLSAELLGVHGVVVYTAGGKVYGATLCAAITLFPVTSVNVTVNDPMACFPGSSLPPFTPPPPQWKFPLGTTLPLPLYVGDGGVGVTLGYPPSTPFPPPPTTIPTILSTVARSHCPNNEVDNKRGDASICLLPPPTAAGTPQGGEYLSYTQGSLLHWGLAILGGEPELWTAERGALSPCSKLIAGGMYGMGVGGGGVGGGAAPTLLPTSVWETAASGGEGMTPPHWLQGAVVLVEGIQGAAGGVALPDPAKCGGALGTAEPNTLVLFGWPIRVFNYSEAAVSTAGTLL